MNRILPLLRLVFKVQLIFLNHKELQVKSKKYSNSTISRKLLAIVFYDLTILVHERTY